MQISIALVITFARPELAVACTQPPPTPPDIWLLDHGDGTVWITFHGYKLFEGDGTVFCGCGLATTSLPALASIDSAAIETPSGTPVAAFSFASNGTTSTSFSGLAGTAIAGFSAGPVTVTGGPTVQLVFRATLAGGATVQDLESQLNAVGNVIVTDEVDAAGVSTVAHLGVRTAGTVMIQGTSVPMLSPLGLMAMLVALAGFAFVGMKATRGRQVAA